jgi:hypothetical protein
MKDFKSSNGVGVRIDDAGDLDFHNRLGWNGLAGGKVVDALREFFRAEEDERLGRWRWPENQNYIVVPDGELGEVGVFDEEALDEARIYARESLTFEGNFGGAAKAYFDAHPEPKPSWHDAKPGQVWEIDYESGESEAALVTTDGRFHLSNGVEVDGKFLELTSDARRIYPKDDS